MARVSRVSDKCSRLRVKLAKFSFCVRDVDTHFRQLCSDCWHSALLSQPSAPGCSAPAPALSVSPAIRRAAPGLTSRLVSRGPGEFRESELSATGQSEHSCRVTLGPGCLSQLATRRTNQDLGSHPSSDSGHPIGRCPAPGQAPLPVLITVLGLAWTRVTQ